MDGTQQSESARGRESEREKLPQILKYAFDEDKYNWIFLRARSFEFDTMLSHHIVVDDVSVVVVN